MKEKTQFQKNILLIVVFFLLLWMFYGLWVLRDFILLFALALTLSIIINDFSSFLQKYHIPRFLSVFLFYLIVFGIFIGSLIFIVPVVLQEIGSLTKMYPDIFQNSFISQFTNQSSYLFSNKDTLLRLFETSSFSRFFTLFTHFFGGVVNFVIVFVLSFYLSIYRNGVDRMIKIFTPYFLEKEILHLWFSIKKKISSWMKGQLVLSLLVFLFTTLALSILKIPYFLILSLIAGIFSLVPYGIVLAIVPALLLSFTSGGWKMSLLIIFIYALIQQLVDYFIQPLISKKMTGVPSILVVIFAIISTKLFGLVGLILAVPFAIVFTETVQLIEKYSKENKV